MGILIAATSSWFKWTWTAATPYLLLGLEEIDRSPSVACRIRFNKATVACMGQVEQTQAGAVQTRMWRQQDDCTMFEVLLCWRTRQRKNEVQHEGYVEETLTSLGSFSKRCSTGVLIEQKIKDSVWFATEEWNGCPVMSSRSWAWALIVTNARCCRMASTPNRSSFIWHEQAEAVCLATP